jgi:hypothetical protein
MKNNVGDLLGRLTFDVQRSMFVLIFFLWALEVER